VVTSAEVIVGEVSHRSVAVAVPAGPPGAEFVPHSRVIFIGHVIAGGVISCTTIVLLQVAEFPQSSVAVHVRVVLYVFGHEPGVDTSENVKVTLGSQASLNVGGVKTGVAGQLIGVV